MRKPSPRPGEVWIIDAGMAAKIRPCLVLTGPPADDELDLVTVVFHTNSPRGNRWELAIAKPFLRKGVYHLQEIHSAPVPRLERKLGELSPEEFNVVLDKLAERLGIWTG